MPDSVVVHMCTPLVCAIHSSRDGCDFWGNLQEVSRLLIDEDRVPFEVAVFERWKHKYVVPYIDNLSLGLGGIYAVPLTKIKMNASTRHQGNDEGHLALGTYPAPRKRLRFLRGIDGKSCSSAAHPEASI